MSRETEKQFREELYLCVKNMGFSLNELYNMPVMDRMAYIRIHNKVTTKINNKLKN